MKIQLKNKKKVLLIILIIATIAFIIFLFLPLFISSLKFKSERSRLKNYFLNEFEVTTIKPTEESEIFHYHENALIRQGIRYLDNNSVLTPTEYSDIAKNIKALFENKCIEEDLEYCDPYQILMPYCMSSRASWLASGGDLVVFKDEIDKDVVYNRAIKYWRIYIEEEELKEDGLSAFVGVVVAEKLCGNLNQDNAENLLKKLLKIKIDENQSVERIVHSLRKKVSVIKVLQDPNHFSQFSQYENLNHSVCDKIPSINEIEKINNVCATYNYYIVKAFCTKEPVINLTRDYLLVTKYLKERYTDLDEIVCQIGVYYLTEK